MENLMQYAVELRDRTTKLERVAQQVKQRGQAQERWSLSSVESFKAELVALNGEIDFLDAEVAGLAQQMRKFIAFVQTIAMREHLSKLSEKADAWHPERNITRSEFTRLLRSDLHVR